MSGFAPYNSHFLGRDGMRYWIGKVPITLKEISQGQNWGERVPVRILGYHTEDLAVLPDADLPVAMIKKPTTTGAGNNASSGIVGGEIVTGYFLDSDDGQQPIIDGVLSTVDPAQPEVSAQDLKSGKGNPYLSTPLYAGQNIPTWRIGVDKSNPDIGSNLNQEGKTSSPKGDYDLRTSGDSTFTAYAVPSLMDSYEFTYLNQEFSGPNNCGTDTVSRIQVEISKVASILKGVKKYYATYVVGSINKVYDFAGQITTIINNIAGVCRTLIQRIRNFVLGTVRREVSAALDIILGDVLKDIKDSVFAKVLDVLFCIFQNIIDDLPGLIGDFLAALLGKLASAPLCAAEKFVNALINSILAELQSALDTALAALGDLFDGVLDIGAQITEIIDLILGILGFLCLTKECSEVTKFNSSPWAGPTKQMQDDYANFLDQLQIPDPTAGVVGWLDEAGLNAGGAAVCTTDPQPCGPPVVDIFGGNPTAEALASAVVSGQGSIVGILLEDSGLGYAYPPFVTFNDPCNYGNGGAGYAEIDADGRLTGVIITNPGYGYIDVPDGEDELTPKPPGPGPGPGPRPSPLPDEDDDGGGGGDGDGGGGDDDGGGGDGGGDDEDDPTPFPPGPTPPTPDPDDDDDDRLTVPVVGCLVGVEILSTGYGYAIGDELFTEPSLPGLILEGQYSDSGQLVAVVVKGEACGWKDTPEIGINSDTGNGARLRPIIAFTKASDFRADDQRKYVNSTLSVIQCTSKKRPLVGYVNGKPYYGPYHEHEGRKMVGASHSPRAHAFIYDTLEESLSALGTFVQRNTSSTSVQSTSSAIPVEPVTPTVSTPTPNPTPNPTPSPSPSPSPSPPSGGGGGGY